MPKTPVQAFKKNVGFYFKKNHTNPEEYTDLFSKEVLCFSALTHKASLDLYLKENFEELYNNNATTYKFPPIQAIDINDDYPQVKAMDVNDHFIICELPDTLIQTFYFTIPPTTGGQYNATKAIKAVEDFQLDICYNRFFLQVDMIKDAQNNNINTLNNYYRILLDPITSEDLQTSLIKHYQTYLYMGMFYLERDTNKTGYISNYILGQEVIGTL